MQLPAPSAFGPQRMQQAKSSFALTQKNREYLQQDFDARISTPVKSFITGQYS
jgi:hypothetical protein